MVGAGGCEPPTSTWSGIEGNAVLQTSHAMLIVTRSIQRATHCPAALTVEGVLTNVADEDFISRVPPVVVGPDPHL